MRARHRRWALDSPFSHVTLAGPRGIPVTWPLPGRKILSGPSMLIAACGAIADCQRRSLVVTDRSVARLLLGVGGVLEMADPATGEAVSRGTGGHLPGVDFEYWIARAARGHWPQAYCLSLWRSCERFAASCRPAIDAAATALIARGELSYAEVSEVAATAMAGHPAPVIPGWAAG